MGAPFHLNALAGRKRPVPTIIPAFGIMGGWNQSHAQFVAGVADRRVSRLPATGTIAGTVPAGADCLTTLPTSRRRVFQPLTNPNPFRVLNFFFAKPPGNGITP